MPDKKKISELQSVVLGNSDYFAVAHDNSGVRQSGKVSTAEVGQKVNGGIEYSGIRKKIIDHQNPIAAINDLQDYIVDSILPTDTVSGAVASLPDGADGIPVKSFKTLITPIQAGSGTPSPSNPRAISARSQFVATQEDGNNTQIDQKTILLGDTVYGGIADITNGSVEIEHDLFTFDGSEGWSATDTHIFRLITTGNNWLPVNAANWAKGYLSNILQTDTRATGATSDKLPDHSFYITSQYLYVRCDEYSTAQEFTTALGTTNLQIYVPKATVSSSEIEAEVFETVKGDNNFYTDCGDSTVEYKADVQLYIDKKTANNRSLGLMMNPMSQPEETREEIEQEDIDNGSNKR